MTHWEIAIRWQGGLARLESSTKPSLKDGELDWTPTPRSARLLHLNLSQVISVTWREVSPLPPGTKIVSSWEETLKDVEDAVLEHPGLSFTELKAVVRRRSVVVRAAIDHLCADQRIDCQKVGRSYVLTPMNTHN